MRGVIGLLEKTRSPKPDGCCQDLCLTESRLPALRPVATRGWERPGPGAVTPLPSPDQVLGPGAASLSPLPPHTSPQCPIVQPAPPSSVPETHLRDRKISVLPHCPGRAEGGGGAGRGLGSFQIYSTHLPPHTHSTPICPQVCSAPLNTELWEEGRERGRKDGGKEGGNVCLHSVPLLLEDGKGRGPAALGLGSWPGSTCTGLQPLDPCL